MATISLHISDELLAELREKAAAEGKSVDEFAAEALKKGLEEQAWQDLIEYGRERGRLAGFTEEQAADVVHKWRGRD
jgi:predicted transcriptional regulator